MRVLITGSAGFIGSAVIRYLIQHTARAVVNVISSLTLAIRTRLPKSAAVSGMPSNTLTLLTVSRWTAFF